MKKVFFIFLFLSTQVASYGQWIEQNSRTEEDLRSVRFLDSNVGYIVGNHGTVLKTTNSGATWIALSSNTLANLQSLCFLDKHLGFIAGNHYDSTTGERYSVLLKTNDGGENWEPLNFPKEEELMQIYYANEQIGFASCGQEGLYKTEDGGKNWQKVSSKNTKAVFFLSHELGYALMGGGIAKTEDGGDSWVQKKDQDSPDYNSANVLITLFFTSSDTGYFGSSYYGGLYSTVDGANSLELQNNATISIDFPTKKRGYLLGHWDGTGIYQTTNAGASWKLIHSTSTPMNDLCFVNNSTGWIIGNEGQILRYNSANEPGKESSDQILIYPNPGDGYLNIEMDNRTAFKSLRIYNSVGELVLSSDQYKKIISLNKMPIGNYLIRIETETGVYTQKVIIK